MDQVWNPAQAREEAAANLDRLNVARAADVIMARATAEINVWLQHFGVSYRVPADDLRLTDVVIDLALSRDGQYKRVANAPDDAAVWAADVRLKASAAAAVQHRIVLQALQQHVRSIESDLVKAVSQYRELSRLGAKHFCENLSDWAPTPEMVALLGPGMAQ